MTSVRVDTVEALVASSEEYCHFFQPNINSSISTMNFVDERFRQVLDGLLKSTEPIHCLVSTGTEFCPERLWPFALFEVFQSLGKSCEYYEVLNNSIIVESAEI
jgi:hypothetical protein